MGKNMLNVRITDEERQLLNDYCETVGRTQSDVIREFIRSLKRKTRKSQNVS